MNTPIRITHSVTAVGGGVMSAGQQRQLLDLVPDDANVDISESRGDQREGTSWTWRASWNNQQDQAWREAQQPDAVATLEQWAAAAPSFGPLPDVDRRCGQPHPTGAGVMTCGLEPGHSGDHRNQGNNPGYSWDTAGNFTHDDIDIFRTEGSDPNTDPDYPKFMADGKTPRCRAVSDGTHGYAKGSQCSRVSGHDTPRNIVGHYYQRQSKATS